MQTTLIATIALFLMCCGPTQTRRCPARQVVRVPCPRPAARPSTRVARPAPRATVNKPAEPTRFELFSVLMQNHYVPLAAAKHCKGVVGQSLARKPTLGDWVAYNLSLLKDGKVKLPTRCKKLDGPASGLVWQCQVEFSVVNPKTNVFWNWGVRFHVRNNDRKLVADSLICIGAG